MVRPRFFRQSGPTLTGSKVLQLMCGADLFGDAYGSGDRADIPAMRRDWSDAGIRETVRSRHRAKWGSGPKCWAELAFGRDGRGGMVRTPADTLAARAEYRRLRDAARAGHKSRERASRGDGAPGGSCPD